MINVECISFFFLETFSRKKILSTSYKILKFYVVYASLCKQRSDALIDCLMLYNKEYTRFLCHMLLSLKLIEEYKQILNKMNS